MPVIDYPAYVAPAPIEGLPLNILLGGGGGGGMKTVAGMGNKKDEVSGWVVHFVAVPAMLLITSPLCTAKAVCPSQTACQRGHCSCSACDTQFPESQ